MGLTKFVLKRPVTTVMALLCLLVFGISSVFSATLEPVSYTHLDVYKRQPMNCAYSTNSFYYICNLFLK